MNITQWASYFDLLQDKFNSPYFTEAEKERFFNSAQIEFVNGIIFDEYFPSSSAGERGAMVSSTAESTVQGQEALETITEIDVPVNTSATGVVSRSDVATALTALSAPTTEYMHVMSVSTATAANVSYSPERIVRFVRANDFIRFQQNEYKKATNSDPVYRVFSGGIKVNPVVNAEPLLITLIRLPREVSISGGTDSELPEFTHQRIIAIAIELAGIASRDEALKALNNDR